MGGRTRGRPVEELARIRRAVADHWGEGGEAGAERVRRALPGCSGLHNRYLSTIATRLKHQREQEEAIAAGIPVLTDDEALRLAVSGAWR